MKRETVIIAALGILTLAGCNNNHRSQVRKFKQTAEKTNRSCPTRMNETITLDSTCYNEKDNSVSYFYSVTGELDNATYMNTHYAAFKQALQDAVDNSVEMEEYRKFGTSIRYIYYSDQVKGNWLHSPSIPPNRFRFSPSGCMIPRYGRLEIIVPKQIFGSGE